MASAGGAVSVSEKFLFFRAEPTKKLPELPELPGSESVGLRATRATRATFQPLGGADEIIFLTSLSSPGALNLGVLRGGFAEEIQSPRLQRASSW